MKFICPKCGEDKIPTCVKCLVRDIISYPSTPEVVIFVDGGNVQDVLSNDNDISIIIIDRDNEREGDEQPNIPEWCKTLIE